MVLTMEIRRHGEKIQSGHEANLQQLGLDYLDMALMHFPIGVANGKPEYDIVATWQAMEKLVSPGHAAIKGKARYIGISNFNVTQVQELLKAATIMPKVRPLIMPSWSTLLRRDGMLIITTGPSIRTPSLPPTKQIRRLPPQRRHPSNCLRPTRRHKPRLPQRRHPGRPLHESRCPPPPPPKPRPRLHRQGARLHRRPGLHCLEPEARHLECTSASEPRGPSD